MHAHAQVERLGRHCAACARDPRLCHWSSEDDGDTRMREGHGHRVVYGQENARVVLCRRARASAQQRGMATVNRGGRRVFSLVGVARAARRLTTAISFFCFFSFVLVCSTPHTHRDQHTHLDQPANLKKRRTDSKTVRLFLLLLLESVFPPPARAQPRGEGNRDPRRAALPSKQQGWGTRSSCCATTTSSARTTPRSTRPATLRTYPGPCRSRRTPTSTAPTSNSAATT